MGVRYTRDDDGRLLMVERKLSIDVEGVSTSQWEECATFEYEGRREIERVQNPYDLKRTQTWTSFKEPQTLKFVKKSNSSLLTGLSTYWDKDGRLLVTSRLHDEDAYKWGEVNRYDEMDRITRTWTNVQDPHNFQSIDPSDSTDTFDDRITYELGKVYERESVKIKPDSGSETTTNYDNNEYYQYTDVGGTSISWDDRGQLTDSGDWEFKWTVLGQLAGADPSSGSVVLYEYDAFRRRAKSTIGSSVHELLYADWNLLGENDGTDWLWMQVPLPLGDRILEHIALDINDLDGDLDTTEFRQYAVHGDAVNTFHAVSNASAEIVERYRYGEPFGETHTEDDSATDIGEFASNVAQCKRMHGGVTDSAPGLYDFRNRWYKPSWGLWLSRDPVGLVDSENLYQAFLHDPTTITDTYGDLCSYSGKLIVRALQNPDKDCGTPAETVAQAAGDWFEVEHLWQNQTCVEYCRVSLFVEFIGAGSPVADSGVNVMPVCKDYKRRKASGATWPLPGGETHKDSGHGGFGGGAGSSMLEYLRERLGGVQDNPTLYYTTAGSPNGRYTGGELLSHEMRHLFGLRHGGKKGQSRGPNPNEDTVCQIAADIEFGCKINAEQGGLAEIKKMCGPQGCCSNTGPPRVKHCSLLRTNQ